VPLDIARPFWWGVGQYHRDVTRSLDLAESAFCRALTFDENSAEILEALTAVQRRSPGRNLVLTIMRLSDARGGDLELLRDAAEVALAQREDASLRRGACEKLFELAVSRWTASSHKRGNEGERAARTLAAWAMRQLVSSAQESSDDARAVELLKRGASLPFPRKETRRMKREAAVLAVERLGDKKGGLAMYRELFEEHQGDETALASLEAFAGLLEADHLDAELVALWERQAQLRAEAKEPANAAELWARAARLSEERLGDVVRAIEDHRHGAQAGGVSSLEALARIHASRGEHADAAVALERICELSPREKLEDNSQRLADAYLAAGDEGRARARLEQALAELKASERIATRLSHLYREDQAWQALAELFCSQAEQTKDRDQRLSYLVQALELQDQKLGDTAATIPLLEQIVELDPDNVQRRLALGDALVQAGRADDAVRILEAQVARFGSRKPKERALVHFALARALEAPKRAVAELQTASRIDPGHAGILNALARLALQDGQLDLAEHTYQSLLLLYRSAQKRPASEHQVSRSDLLLGLAEIAEKKGDADRAAEFRASATSTSYSINPPASISP
jgi:tetratricopeptide (TPR) repeat protein